MIVCVCHRVSDRDIARAAQQGCADFDELQFELSVATSCGRCHECARETFHHHAAQREQELHVVGSQTDAARCPAARRVVVIHPDLVLPTGA